MANVTPWALNDLLGDAAPAALRREVAHRRPTWGAFTLYLGLDISALPPDRTRPPPGHRRCRLGRWAKATPSLSRWPIRQDSTRAPAGKIAATLSTHTAVTPWWELAKRDRPAYLARREAYAERLLSAAEQALPGIGRAVTLCLPGTPVTFDFYTRRPQGMVGGFPQTSLFEARGPRTGIPNLWLVGDSIFPGQSTAGVTLGAIRVAADILQSSP